MTDPRATLLRAADLIDKHGWVQGELETTKGCLCAEGAIIRATHEGKHYMTPTRMDAIEAACSSLRTHLCVFGWVAIPVWNDEPGRTAAEVTAALRAAANVQGVTR